MNIKDKLKMMRSMRNLTRSPKRVSMRGMPESQYLWGFRGRYGRLRLGSNKKHFCTGYTYTMDLVRGRYEGFVG